MPTYEYQCRACSYRFDAQQSMRAAKRRRCPQCRKNALERLISAPALILSAPRVPLAAAVDEMVGDRPSSRPPSLATTNRQLKPSIENLGLQRLSLVGNRLVVSPNLTGQPPGSFGKEGRVLVVKDKKKGRVPKG